MRYSLRYLNNKYIQEVSEINLYHHWSNNAILDAMEKNGFADIVISPQADMDWPFLEQMNQKMREQGRRLIVAVMNILNADEAKAHNMDFYFNYPFSTYADLEFAKAVGACYAIIGAPLFFELDQVKKFDIPLRAVADRADNGTFAEHRINWNGAFIRPEDVRFYEQYFEIIEFNSFDQEREETAYRIYARDHAWSGDLSILIRNLNKSTTNRMLPEDFATHRANCHQVCARNAQCHWCQRAMDLANPSKIKKYVNEVRTPSPDSSI